VEIKGRIVSVPSPSQGNRGGGTPSQSTEKRTDQKKGGKKGTKKKNTTFSLSDRTDREKGGCYFWQCRKGGQTRQIWVAKNNLENGCDAGHLRNGIGKKKTRRSETPQKD